MKKLNRNIAHEIVAELKKINRVLETGIPLAKKFTVRTVEIVPFPNEYGPKQVRATRDLLGVSQPVFARMLGVSAALVRAWELGQRRSLAACWT